MHEPKGVRVPGTGLGFDYTDAGASISDTVVSYTDTVNKDSEGGAMALEDNGFMEYLQLQGSDPELVTKSELIAAVRKRGYSVGDRQLTFYVSEGLVPKSVRAGSRAGVYPRIVVQLLAWILRAKEGGLSVEAIRELLPVWKYLVRARNDGRIDLSELEYIARQHVATIEGSYAIPAVVADVLHDSVCSKCRAKLVLALKDGTERALNDPSTTIGFAIARRGDEESGQTEAKWVGVTRIALAGLGDGIAKDPTTVILGLRPNEAVPPDSPEPGHSDPSGASHDHPKETV
jgi:DNA-binding transcriptional MerR regulator